MYFLKRLGKQESSQVFSVLYSGSARNPNRCCCRKVVTHYMTAYNRDVADLVFMNNFHFIQQCRKHIATGWGRQRRENYSCEQEMWAPTNTNYASLVFVGRLYILVSHCNPPALVPKELADLAAWFGYKVGVDIDDLPEFMQDVGAGQYCLW